MTGGERAFSLIAALCGVPVEADELNHRFAGAAGFGVVEMLRAAPALGLRARVLPDRAPPRAEQVAEVHLGGSEIPPDL